MIYSGRLPQILHSTHQENRQLYEELTAGLPARLCMLKSIREVGRYINLQLTSNDIFL